MESNFNHIRWAPLSVTIFITHMRILRNRSYANVAIRLFDWSFRASRPWWFHLCCTFSIFYDIICDEHFLHFKAQYVNSVYKYKENNHKCTYKVVKHKMTSRIGIMSLVRLPALLNYQWATALLDQCCECQKRVNMSWLKSLPTSYMVPSMYFMSPSPCLLSICQSPSYRSPFLYTWNDKKDFCKWMQKCIRMGINIQSTLDTSNFKGLGKICRVISSSR